MRVEIEESFKRLRIVVRNDGGLPIMSLTVKEAHEFADQLKQAADAYDMLYPDKEQKT